MPRITDYPSVSALGGTDLFILDGINGTKKVTAEVMAKYCRSLVEANIASVENTTTASKDYQEGNLLIVNGVLFEATDDIYYGDTLSTSTNIKQASIDKLLKGKADLDSNGKVPQSQLPIQEVDVDDYVTENSDNPVKSSGIYSELIKRATTFIGSQSTWDNLSSAEKAAFNVALFNDDYSPSSGGGSGATILDAYSASPAADAVYSAAMMNSQLAPNVLLQTTDQTIKGAINELNSQLVNHSCDKNISVYAAEDIIALYNASLISLADIQRNTLEITIFSQNASDTKFNEQTVEFASAIKLLLVKYYVVVPTYTYKGYLHIVPSIGNTAVIENTISSIKRNVVITDSTHLKFTNAYSGASPSSDTAYNKYCWPYEIVGIRA